jgi:hypothetical protein
VIELGNGIYQAYVALPVNSPMTFVWDDTQGRFMPDSVCPVLPTPPADWLSSAAVSAAAVAKLQSGLSTYAGGDTSGTTTLLGRLTSGRAGNLDNLDTAISTRSTYAGGDTTGTTTLLTRVGRTMWIDTAGRVAASIPGI